MQEWYLPITILPALGMFILSTTSQMMTLSSEINSLLQEKCTEFQHLISAKKLRQLDLLTRAGALLYLASGSYVLSGILGAVFETNSGALRVRPETTGMISMPCDPSGYQSDVCDEEPAFG